MQHHDVDVHDIRTLGQGTVSIHGFVGIGWNLEEYAMAMNMFLYEKETEYIIILT